MSESKIQRQLLLENLGEEKELTHRNEQPGKMASLEVGRKKCKMCGILKSTTEFHRHKMAADKLKQDCKECRSKEFSRKWRENLEENRKKGREISNRWRAKNIIKARERERLARRGENRGKILAKGRDQIKRHLSNPGNKKKHYERNKRRAKLRRSDPELRKILLCYERNYRIHRKIVSPDKVKEINRKYANTPKGRAARKAASSKRRARIRYAILGDIKSKILELMNSEILKCRYCGIIMKQGEWEADHIIPLSRGGMHSPENIAPSCRFCNRSKGSQTEEEFLLRRNNL